MEEAMKKGMRRQRGRGMRIAERELRRRWMKKEGTEDARKRWRRFEKRWRR